MRNSLLNTSVEFADIYDGDTMNSLNVADIKNDETFTAPIYIDKNFLLLADGVPFKASLKSILLEWNFKTVQIDNEAQLAKTAAAKPIDLKAFESVSIDDVMNDTAEDEKENAKNAVALQNNKEINETIAKYSEELKGIEESDLDTKQLLVQKVYDAFKNYITKIYTRFVTHRELKIGLISEAVQNFCAFIADNKKYVLRIQPQLDENDNKNFIVGHSIRSTVFAIVIGQTLKLQTTKLVELGVAALLHEIGQIRLPPQLYITDKKLTSAERRSLEKHTIYGVQILKENNFPTSIQFAVFEHHERENGKGYPRKIDGSKISLYGKILSVVCSYEAISAPRQYKDAKSTHEAIIEMLRNEDKQYDDTLIKILVQNVSLFPIGGYVSLSNGKIGQVVDTNKFDPRTPIVQILGEKNEAGFPVTIQTDNERIKITRVLTPEETAEAIKNGGKLQ